MLLVVKRAENGTGGVARWICKCDCGNRTVVRANNLKSGAVKSCGCLQKKSVVKTHGMSKTKLYYIWRDMIERCESKKSKSYKDYGYRGIGICEEWRRDFIHFYNWSVASGYQEGLTIDRIDFNKGYCPENCRWITKGEQAKNRRMNYKIEYNGEIKTLQELCDELKLNYKRVHNRINKLGWSLERAINTPVQESKRNMKARNKYGNNK